MQISNLFLNIFKTILKIRNFDEFKIYIDGNITNVDNIPNYYELESLEKECYKLKTKIAFLDSDINYLKKTNKTFQDKAGEYENSYTAYNKENEIFQKTSEEDFKELEKNIYIKEKELINVKESIEKIVEKDQANRAKEEKLAREYNELQKNNKDKSVKEKLEKLRSNLKNYENYCDNHRKRTYELKYYLEYFRI